MGCLQSRQSRPVACWTDQGGATDAVRSQQPSDGLHRSAGRHPVAEDRGHAGSSCPMTSSAEVGSGPLTRVELAAGIRALGAEDGDTLLVHASLASFGFVIGGAQAVVQALFDVVGPTGTIVVPAFTADNSDPSRWVRT